MRKTGPDRPEFCLPVETRKGVALIRYRKDPVALTEVRLPRPGQGCGGAAREEKPPAAVASAAKELVRYFEGEKPRVDLSVLDFGGLSPAMVAVLRCCAEVPYGKVTSYGELARRAGFPRGARFAGNALSRNPFPVFIPCHRVLRSDGGMGGFTGGLDLKGMLLDLEKENEE